MKEARDAAQQKHTQSAAHFYEHLMVFDKNSQWQSDNDRKAYLGGINATTEDQMTSLYANASNSDKKNVLKLVDAFSACVRDTQFSVCLGRLLLRGVWCGMLVAF